MRTPKRNNRSKVQTSSVASIPAPIGGWNARDALADMKPKDAVVLENWFPRTAYVEGRGGFTSHATGLTGNGKTLATHNALNGTSKFFAFTDSGIYDVSSAGAVGASGLARTNGKHQCVNFGDGTYNYLIACNGVDGPAYYDGSSWLEVTGITSPALTGVPTTDLIAPIVFKGRLIFIQKASLSFWYLAAGAAGGALTEFDLSGEAERGGYLMAGMAWALDAGAGVDDYLILITSEGEVIVYQGISPSSSTTWSKVGTFYLGSPLGRRCLTKFGGDVIAITETGVYPISRALAAASMNNETALSYKIESAFVDSAAASGSAFGWEAILYPAESALIVNIPTTEDGIHTQYVMNTITKAWCKFTGWDAECFGLYSGALYFCDGTTVYKAWNGTADNGSEIVMYGKQAFNYFGDRGSSKHFDMFQPVMAVNGSFSFLTDIDVDFKDTEINGVASYTVINGGSWDGGNWDEIYWAAGLEIVKEWTSPDENVGYCASGKLKINTDSLTIQWMSSNYTFRKGGVL